MPENRLETVTLQGLQKCLARLSRISTDNWRAASVKVYPGKAADALAPYASKDVAAVCMVMDAMPLACVMAADPLDIECLSKGFTGHSFPNGGRITPADEIMLEELGNIVINAMVNSLLNALKSSVLPALPRFVHGTAERLTAELGPRMDLNKDYRIISVKVVLDCGGLRALLDLFTLLPEELARQLD